MPRVENPLSRRRLKERLLPRTLRYVAQNIPYYAKLQRGGHRLDHLKDFPVVYKELMAEHFEDFLNLSQIPNFVTLTGGTTRAPTASFQTNEELERIFSHGHDLRPGQKFPQSSITGVSLHLNARGVISGAGPEGRPTLTIPFVTEQCSNLALAFLESGVKLRDRRVPITQLLTPARQIKFFTHWLESTGHAHAPQPLETVIVYSDYLSQAWKRRLSDFWGARIRAAYGLSEFQYAIGLECLFCGAFHFPPYVHFEILSDCSASPGEEDCGILALTSLYPFIKSHPHIRYRTGDLVRRGVWCPAAAESGVHLLGREQNCLRLNTDQGEIVFSQFDLLEVLSNLDGVAWESQTFSWDAKQPIVDHTHATGSPLVISSISKRTDGTATLSLLVGAISPEEHWPELEAEIERRIWALVLANAKLRPGLTVTISACRAATVRQHADFRPLC